MKKVLRILKLGPMMRELRWSGYWLADAIGSIYFAMLRLFGVMQGCDHFDKRKIAKILIIRIDRIGDLILSTPAIEAVRNTFADAEIHLLVSEYTKDLVINNQNVNRILIHEKDVPDRDYDLAISLHPGMVPNRLTFKSRAKWRVGYTGKGGGFCLTHKLTDDREKRIRHEVESALEVAAAAGCEAEDKSLEISITEEGEHFAETFFRDNSILPDQLTVMIHPGARQEYIRWRKQGFAEVADALMHQNAKVIFIGGKHERQIVEDTAAMMKIKPLCVTDLSLAQLVSVIKRCSLFIGNSTGTMHIAAALRVPVVAIFGNIHPLDSYQEWAPWGKDHIIVSKDLKCHECHPTDCDTFDCMRLITAKDVMKAANSLIESRFMAEAKT